MNFFINVVHISLFFPPRFVLREIFMGKNKKQTTQKLTAPAQSLNSLEKESYWV